MLPGGLRVPQDIALIGYDDIDFASASVVPLSSIRQPAGVIGRRAVELLLDESFAEDEESFETDRVLFQPELIVRDSTRSGARALERRREAVVRRSRPPVASRRAGRRSPSCRGHDGNGPRSTSSTNTAPPVHAIRRASRTGPVSRAPCEVAPAGASESRAVVEPVLDAAGPVPR